MNWVDLAILGLLVLFAFEGFGRSFFGELLDFISFLLAFILSLRLYNLAAIFFTEQFKVPHSLANVLGFITVWFLVEFLLFFLVHLILSRVKIPLFFNRLNYLAFIPGLLRGFIFTAIILVLVGSFPIQPKFKIAVEESKIGSFILKRAHQLETPLKNVFGGITEDTLTFLTIKPKSDESVDLGFKTTDYRPNPGLESRMIELVNKERGERGLEKVTFDEGLREVGRVHSGDMFTRGYFSHYSPEGETVADRADKRGVKYFVIGENLAYAPDLELAHKGLMNSEGHRANILSKEFNKVGIGIMDGGVYGLMITQVFSN